HLSADPVASVAVDMDFAAFHLGAEVHAHIAVDGKTPRCHAGAKPLDAAAIALDDNLAVPGIAPDSEEFAERRRGVAVLHGESGDFRSTLASEIVGRDALGLDGDRGGAAIAETEHPLCLREQLVQMQVERAEFATVVAGRDAHHTRPAGGAHAGAR